MWHDVGSPVHSKELCLLLTHSFYSLGNVFVFKELNYLLLLLLLHQHPMIFVQVFLSLFLSLFIKLPFYKCRSAVDCIRKNVDSSSFNDFYCVLKQLTFFSQVHQVHEMLQQSNVYSSLSAEKTDSSRKARSHVSRTANPNAKFRLSL